jgi:hypothetical protein
MQVFLRALAMQARSDPAKDLPFNPTELRGTSSITESVGMPMRIRNDARMLSPLSESDWRRV